MSKYENLVNEIIEAIGGQENISSVYHCVTRLRFSLKDQKKADDKAVENLSGVLGLAKSGGQYQIIIGNHVSDVYEVLCKVASITQSRDDEPKERKSIMGTIQDFMSSVMGPLIPILAAGG